MLLDARALPPVAALGVDAVHDWGLRFLRPPGRRRLIEAERVVVGGAASRRDAVAVARPY